jgi:hypothetical protein
MKGNIFDPNRLKTTQKCGLHLGNYWLNKDIDELSNLVDSK